MADIRTQLHKQHGLTSNRLYLYTSPSRRKHTTLLTISQQLSTVLTISHHISPYFTIYITPTPPNHLCVSFSSATKPVTHTTPPSGLPSHPPASVTPCTISPPYSKPPSSQPTSTPPRCSGASRRSHPIVRSTAFGRCCDANTVCSNGSVGRCQFLTHTTNPTRRYSNPTSFATRTSVTIHPMPICTRLSTRRTRLISHHTL